MLGINTKRLALGRVHFNNAMVYHVLKVGKTSPNVGQVVVRVVTGPREPNPEVKSEKKGKDLKIKGETDEKAEKLLLQTFKYQGCFAPDIHTTESIFFK